MKYKMKTLPEVIVALIKDGYSVNYLGMWENPNSKVVLSNSNLGDCGNTFDADAAIVKNFPKACFEEIKDPIKYPCFMQGKESGNVFLMDKDGSGLQLSGTNMGLYSNTWRMSQMKPIDIKKWLEDKQK